MIIFVLNLGFLRKTDKKNPAKRMHKTEHIPQCCLSAWRKAGAGKVLLAVSGGADSTALLHACVECGIPCEAAHCNFNLRGPESIRDRDFVQGLCRRLGVVCHTVEFQTLDVMEKGESVEMACRRLRYDFFHRLLKEKGFSRILTAHNADDNIETLFLNLLRGSGVNGLKGMVEDTGTILRPLLSTSRKEILEYLRATNETYVTDSTNAGSDYRRNFLRNEVLPLIETRWPGMRTALLRSIRILQNEAKIINDTITALISGNTDVLEIGMIKSFSEPESLVFSFINRFGGNSPQAAEIVESINSGNIGKRWIFAEGNTAVLTKDALRIIKGANCGQEPEVRYRWTRITPEEFKHHDRSNDVIYLPAPEEDYQWIEADGSAKIKSLGVPGSQSVKKILKEGGLLPEERKNFKVLAHKNTGEIIWVPGLKRSRLHLIDEHTKEIYKVERM